MIDAVGRAWSDVFVRDVELVGRARVPCNEPSQLRRATEKIVERMLLGCLQSTLYLIRYLCAQFDILVLRFGFEEDA